MKFKATRSAGKNGAGAAGDPGNGIAIPHLAAVMAKRLETDRRVECAESHFGHCDTGDDAVLARIEAGRSGCIGWNCRVGRHIADKTEVFG